VAFDDLLAAAGAPAPVERGDDAVGAIVYTSGTTGRPRGAVLTRGNLAANQDQSLAGRFDVGPQDVVLLVLPLAHIYALNVGLGASVTAGASMVLVDRFDPDVTLRTIADHGVTVVLGAPPMYVAWLESGHLDRTAFASVRLAVSGAAALPVQVFERFREVTGIAIEEGYGLTEAAPSVASSSMADAPRAGSVGLPLPDVQVRLVDDEGHDVEPGDPGEVWVRGPNVFAGYHGDPEASAAVLTPDGWLRTGDVATRDEDGFLYLVDRKKDLIIVNGFNVYPREVERVLYEDDRVAQAAAFGVPHVLTGETVVAAVVPREGTSSTPTSSSPGCRRQLARYKCPTRIDVLPSCRPPRPARSGAGRCATREPAPPAGVVYTRARCGLCRRAEALVAREARRAEVHHVDVDADPSSSRATACGSRSSRSTGSRWPSSSSRRAPCAGRSGPPAGGVPAPGRRSWVAGGVAP
jgi:long-chain acyl-CoA synthetase